ncbi:MAG: CBS domain-containing protein [Gammaproteobacteria bacterium]|nr:CBS domain-containing protein [Gammaproteobacteria bacterium]
MLRAVRVKDYMAASLVTFEPEMDVLRAVHMLVENGISGAPVVDEHGNLIGVLSEKDCLRVALHAGYHEFHGGKVSEFMSGQVTTVEADASIVDVAEMFIRDDYRRYPVVSNNRLVGQISRHDVLRALEQLW